MGPTGKPLNDVGDTAVMAQRMEEMLFKAEVSEFDSSFPPKEFVRAFMAGNGINRPHGYQIADADIGDFFRKSLVPNIIQCLLRL
jgi:hypothetical protein